MALIENLTTEVVTAIGVSFGALFGGVAALIGELRKPAKPSSESEAVEKESREASAALLEEEMEHLTRTMWIIERRLSDHLVRIEGRLALTRPDEEPPPRPARRKGVISAGEEQEPEPEAPMRDE